MNQELIFSHLKFSDGLRADILRMNPWWQEKPLPVLPETRRHLVEQIKKWIERRLAPIVVIRGPVRSEK